MIAASFPPILDPNLIFDKYALAHEQESQTSCLANAVLVVKMIEERFAKYAHNHWNIQFPSAMNIYKPSK